MNVERSIHPAIVLVLHGWVILLSHFEPTFYHYVTTFAGWASAGLTALFALYVVVMRFKRRREREGGLEWYEWAIVGPALAIGYPLDVFLNWTYVAVLFWDRAEEATITARLNRYVSEPQYAGTWRRALAWDIGHDLNKHDSDHVEREA